MNLNWTAVKKYHDILKNDAKILKNMYFMKYVVQLFGNNEVTLTLDSLLAACVDSLY